MIAKVRRSSASLSGRSARAESLISSSGRAFGRLAAAQLWVRLAILGARGPENKGGGARERGLSPVRRIGMLRGRAFRDRRHARALELACPALVEDRTIAGAKAHVVRSEERRVGNVRRLLRPVDLERDIVLAGTK